MLSARRVVFQAPNTVELEPFELDDTNLGPTEAIIRTRVTLISPGTELANLHGRLGMHTDAPREYPMTGVGYANIAEDAIEPAVMALAAAVLG